MFSKNQKLLVVGLVVLLLASFLVGCGGKEPSQDPVQGDQGKEAKSILSDIYLVGATQGAIILTLEPPITIFLGYLVFKEVLTGLQIFGAILILLAVVLPQVLDWRARKSPRDIGEKA